MNTSPHARRWTPGWILGAMLAVALAAAVGQPPATPETAPQPESAVKAETAMSTAPLVLKVYRHSTWEAHPPVGHAADAMRRNLRPDSSFEFQGTELTLLSMTAGDEANPEAAKDWAMIRLDQGDKPEELRVTEGEVIHWGGFRIAVPAIRTTRGELGFSVTEFEIATIESLPKALAESTVAGDATFRLRVPHKIEKITLHHSATALNPGDDLGKKLSALQTWGQRDRNWWDVPYHFFVDLEGRYWEGRDYRYMGETNTTYNPWGYFLINCYGNWEANEPNQKQIEAVANLMAWACAEFGVSPEELYGHKDLAETSCPGKNLYRYLEDGTFKRMVKERLAKGAPKLEYVTKIPKP